MVVARWYGTDLCRSAAPLQPEQALRAGAAATLHPRYGFILNDGEETGVTTGVCRGLVRKPLRAPSKTSAPMSEPCPCPCGGPRRSWQAVGVWEAAAGAGPCTQRGLLWRPHLDVPLNV